MSEKNRLKLIKLRKQAVEDDKTMTSEKFREKYFSDLESLLGFIDDQIDKELSKAGADKVYHRRSHSYLFVTPQESLKSNL